MNSNETKIKKKKIRSLADLRREAIAKAKKNALKTEGLLIGIKPQLYFFLDEWTIWEKMRDPSFWEKNPLLKEKANNINYYEVIKLLPKKREHQFPQSLIRFTPTPNQRYAIPEVTSTFYQNTIKALRIKGEVGFYYFSGVLSNDKKDKNFKKYFPDMLDLSRVSGMASRSLSILRFDSEVLCKIGAIKVTEIFGGIQPKIKTKRRTHTFEWNTCLQCFPIDDP